MEENKTNLSTLQEDLLPVVETIPVMGEISENCFLYGDPKTKEAFVIDPGAEPEKILALALKEGFQIRKILLTHGHFDHIGGALSLARALKIPIYAKEGSAYLADPSMNLSAFYGEPIQIQEYTPVSEGMEIRLSGSSDLTLCVMEVPGHTTDSVLYLDKDNGIAFSGDTIFKGSYGNYMLPGGDRRTLFDSLLTKVLTLPEDTKLYSGHSDMTTVGEEKIHYL